MRIDYSILVKDGKKPVGDMDVDLDILSFVSHGKNYNVDMVGWIDTWKEGNYIKGTLKSDGLKDVYNENLTYEEIEEAFKDAENIVFECHIYNDTDTDGKLVSWETQVQIGDTIKNCKGEY